MRKKMLIVFVISIIVIIVIISINLTIKKYEKEPLSPPGFSLRQEQKQTANTAAENTAPQANGDVESEPPISTKQPLPY
jgi:uncharacterized protein YpmB